MAEKKESNHEDQTDELENIVDLTMEPTKKTEDLINKLEKENHDLKDKWQRALADYQNLERRTQIEISQRVSDKTNNLFLNFINIYEDFIRAENSLSKEKIEKLQELETKLKDYIGDVEAITQPTDIFQNDKTTIVVVCSKPDFDYIIKNKKDDEIFILKANPLCQLISQK